MPFSRLPILQTTTPLELIPLGRQHRLLAVIVSDNPDQLAGPVLPDALGDPGRHGLGCRARQRQRRQIQMCTLGQVGTGG